MAGLEKFEVAFVAGDGFRGIEEKVADLTEFFGPRGGVFPAQSQIERQLVGELIIVLNIQAVVAAVDLERRAETEVACDMKTL
ncbi:MAG: hypothetical protein EXQ52_03785 [Bryobacterales bacterium]|nr:hypothetical protein [Bryobacterales bacterium]